MSNQNAKIIIVGAVIGAVIDSVIHNAAKRRREEEERNRREAFVNQALEHVAQLSVNATAGFIDWRQREIDENRHRTQIR